jgi:4-amino-4-deoxy-L-arabinose transferase-like glycosyltransferase
VSAERRRTPLDPPPRPGSGGGPPRRSPSTFGLSPTLTGRIGPWLGLIALCLALYLPGLAVLPPVDRDEARFAQASKQMLETGDFVRIRYQDEARNKKPVGIYWAQAASASLLGGAAAPIWAFRLPSLLALTVAVLLLYEAGRRLFEARTAFLAASLLASCLLAVVEAHLAKTDAALLAATVAAQGALGVIYLRGRADLPRGWLLPIGFWTALGLGVLIKGPVLPLIAGLTVAALAVADRSLAWWRGARPIVGVVIAVAIVAPWGIAITAATDGSFVADAVAGDLLPKLLGAQESHGAPPGAYLAMLAIGFFPASLWVAPALRDAWKRRLLPAERFCLAWLLPAWLVFELVPTKLPHYVLPLYPALALLSARCIIGENRVARAPAGWVRVLMVVWLGVALALAGAVVALPLVVDGQFDWIGLVPALASAVGAAAALICAWHGQALRSIGIAIAAAGVLFATALGTVMPRVEGLWLSRQALEMVTAFRPSGNAPVIAAGYAEPSLVFLIGTDTRLAGGAAAADLLAAEPDAVALVAADEEPAFLAEAAARTLAVQALDRRAGYNYSRGRRTTLALYRRAR